MDVLKHLRNLQKLAEGW